MENIRLFFESNRIEISLSNEGLNVNKSIIKNGSLYYTPKYIVDNKEEIKQIIKEHKIEEVTYKSEKAFIYLNSLFDKEKIIFSYNNSLSTKVLDRLLKNKNLKYIECYFIPSDYIHKFSIKNISVVFKNDYSFDSNFILYNDFNNLKEIYYKKSINFYSKKEIENNLSYFLKINKNLKVINLYYYSKDSITFIKKILNEYNKSDIKILIHLTEDNNLVIGKDSSYLKKLNKDKTNEIKIVYSDDYFNNRILNTFYMNTIKTSLIGMLYIGVVLIFSNAYHEYSAALELRKLENELRESTVVTEIQIDEINDLPKEETEVEDEIVEEKIDPYASITFDFNKLKEINSDTVAWLYVRGTNINYPVMKTTNNSYYLSHDIFENYMATGWIFMDYRVNENSRNTIIYGHAALSGIMFGTLHNTVYPYWYNNEYNTIKLTTLDNEYKYRVFSIYKLEETSDYLRVNFNSDEDFLEYTNMIKERSIHDFQIEIKPTDKIITLSTCSGNNRRLVLHAVQI